MMKVIYNNMLMQMIDDEVLVLFNFFFYVMAFKKDVKKLNYSFFLKIYINNLIKY